MGTKEDTAAIRKALKARGFTGSVRMAKGTAYGWIDITGTADEYGSFPDAENAVLRNAFGYDAGRSNFFLIAPDHENTRTTRSYALQRLQAERGAR